MTRNKGTKLTFGSLFAGIGGLDLGLERAGMTCKWQVEIDDYAQQVLAKHWPDMQRWGDVRTWPQPDAERVDLICGGFPCQDISPAGKGRGLAGKRSGLWYEMRRIIEEIKPSWVIVENSWARWRSWVPDVRRDLWRIGYASLPIRLRASDFGLFHRRARAFVVAHLDEIGCDWGGRLQKAAEKAGDLFAEGDYTATAHIDRTRQLQPQGIHGEKRRRTGDGVAQTGSIRTIEPCLGRGVHGFPDRLDRIKCLGNAVVPQVAEWIGQRILETEGLR